MSLSVRLPLSDETVTHGYDSSSGGSIVLVNSGVTSVQDTTYKQVALFSGAGHLTLEASRVPSAAAGSRPRCFSLWAKPSAPSIALFSSGGGSIDGGLFRAFVTADRQVSVDYAGLPVSVTASSLPLDTWSHVVVCYDGEFVKCYINGTVALDEGRVLSTIASAVYIGKAHGDGSALGFTGSMTDFRIYNNALTQRDISDLFEDGPNELLKLGTSDLTVFRHSGIQPDIIENESAVALGDVTTTSLTLIDELSSSGDTELQSHVYLHDDTTSARICISENTQTVNQNATACTSAVRLCTDSGMQTCLRYGGESVGIHCTDQTTHPATDECIATVDFDGLSFDSDEAAVVLGPLSEFRIKYDDVSDTLQIQHLEGGVYRTKVEYGR